MFDVMLQFNMLRCDWAHGSHTCKWSSFIQIETRILHTMFNFVSHTYRNIFLLNGGRWGEFLRLLATINPPHIDWQQFKFCFTSYSISLFANRLYIIWCNSLLPFYFKWFGFGVMMPFDFTVAVVVVVVVVADATLNRASDSSRLIARVNQSNMDKLHMIKTSFFFAIWLNAK